MAGVDCCNISMSADSELSACADKQAMYLSPPSLRHTTFATPPQDAVDFRAVCFCHHDVVDVGFVCSVCLSSKSVLLYLASHI